MKNKKIITYVVIFLTGVLLSGLFFSQILTQKEHVHTAEKKEDGKQMWTCSMHPSVMKNEPGDCPICGMDLIPITMDVVEETNPNQFTMTKNAMALADIRTTVVGNKQTDDHQNSVLSGLISENKDEIATQSAHFNGRIEKLYVKSLGQKVTKGQPVAEVYSSELITAQQELLIAAKTKNTQPSLYNAVRNKFKNWYIHQHQIDEIEKNGEIKTNLTIYAHVAGVVTDVSVELGSHIMTGKPIFKVANLNTVWANFDVYEHQISLFKVGQIVEIKVNQESNKTIQGKVSFIDPILNEQTRTVNLRVVLNNKDQSLKPGMFVEGEVENNTAISSEIEVPASAVLWTGKRSVVYVKANKEQPVFEMKEIVLGNKIGEYYIVLSGLNNGDEVVTEGAFTVDAAAQLQGKKSMMNKVEQEPKKHQH